METIYPVPATERNSLMHGENGKENRKFHLSRPVAITIWIVDLASITVQDCNPDSVFLPISFVP